MKVTTGILAGALALVCTTVGPASARGAVHEFQAEHYDATEPFAAGEGPCVPWAGSFHEVRDGGYRIVRPPGGQLAGEFHVNGLIHGFVELVPEDPSLPTYSGTYREKVNAVATSLTDEGDVSRVAQYRLRSTLRGTDGSSLDLRLSGKMTVNANGRVVVSRDVFTCA